MRNELHFGPDGKLEAYAWPGGYPICYLDLEESILCPACATKSLQDPDEVPQFKPVAWYYCDEGEIEFCMQCSKEIK